MKNQHVILMVSCERTIVAVCYVGRVGSGKRKVTVLCLSVCLSVLSLCGFLAPYEKR